MFDFDAKSVKELLTYLWHAELYKQYDEVSQALEAAERHAAEEAKRQQRLEASWAKV